MEVYAGGCGMSSWAVCTGVRLVCAGGREVPAKRSPLHNPLLGYTYGQPTQFGSKVCLRGND